MKECRKRKKTLGEINSFTQFLLSLLSTLKQAPPHFTELLEQFAQVLTVRAVSA